MTNIMKINYVYLHQKRHSFMDVHLVRSLAEQIFCIDIWIIRQIFLKCNIYLTLICKIKPPKKGKIKVNLTHHSHDKFMLLFEQIARYWCYNKNYWKKMKIKLGKCKHTV